MSVNTANICPAILTSLSDNAINNPQSVGIVGGALKALTLPQNLARGRVIRGANDSGTGHSKEVRIVYKRRRLASDTVDVKNCDFGPTSEYIEESFQVTQYRGISQSMTEAQVRAYCDAYSELVRLTGANNPGMIVERASQRGDAQGALSVIREMFSDIRLMSNALVQAINQDILTSIAAAYGTWLGGVTSKTYAIQNADGSLNAGELFRMKQDIMVTTFEGAPIIIGGAGPLQQVWMNDSRFFGQGANGVDFSTVRANTGIADFEYDQNVASEFGAETDAAIFIPGSLIYTPFLQYEGQFGKIGTMERFTMPIPGAEYARADMRILPDECNENYNVWMEAYFDVYAAPTNMFPAGDALEGINGVFEASFTKAA